MITTLMDEGSKFTKKKEKEAVIRDPDPDLIRDQGHIQGPDRAPGPEDHDQSHAGLEAAVEVERRKNRSPVPGQGVAVGSKKKPLVQGVAARGQSLDQNLDMMDPSLDPDQSRHLILRDHPVDPSDQQAVITAKKGN